MKFLANINYIGEPTALIKYGGTEKNIYPALNNMTKKQINKDYNESRLIAVPDKTIREVFPEEWKLNLSLKHLVDKLPDHVKANL